MSERNIEPQYAPISESMISLSNYSDGKYVHAGAASESSSRPMELRKGFGTPSHGFDRAVRVTDVRRVNSRSATRAHRCELRARESRATQVPLRTLGLFRSRCRWGDLQGQPSLRLQEVQRKRVPVPTPRGGPAQAGRAHKLRREPVDDRDVRQAGGTNAGLERPHRRLGIQLQGAPENNEKRQPDRRQPGDL